MTPHDWVIIGYWSCVGIVGIILVALLMIDDMSRPRD